VRILRGWTECNERRVLMTPDGAVVAQKGEFVAIVVGKSWDEVARVVAKLQDPEPPNET
jgi:hypothetical protein